MGRSQKPLSIDVDDEIYAWPEIQALIAQGHQIRVIHDDEFDLLLSTRAHRMNEDLRKYLPLALAEARRVRYPKGEKSDG